MEQLLNKISADLSYLRGKYDADIPSLHKKIDCLDKRTNALERSDNYRRGQSVAISFITSVLITIGGFFIKK